MTSEEALETFVTRSGHVIDIPRIPMLTTADISGMIDDAGPCEVEFDLRSLSAEEALDLAEQIKRRFLSDVAKGG